MKKHLFEEVLLIFASLIEFDSDHSWLTYVSTLHRETICVNTSFGVRNESAFKAGNALSFPIPTGTRKEDSLLLHIACIRATTSSCSLTRHTGKSYSF